MSGTWPQDFLVVTDFDGTLTIKDIGNELCETVLGDSWRELYRQLRTKTLGLKEYQRKVWEHFPLGEKEFLERSLEFAELRPGVQDFLEAAVDSGTPVFVASCGLRPYIEVTLREKLSSKARSAIREIRCNEVVFGACSIERFIPPVTSDSCPYPLDKGEWSQELGARYGSAKKILGIGNGTSDRSFWGHVTVLAATEALQTWAAENKKEHISFSDFLGLSESLKLL